MSSFKETESTTAQTANDSATVTKAAEPSQGTPFAEIYPVGESMNDNVYYLLLGILLVMILALGILLWDKLQDRPGAKRRTRGERSSKKARDKKHRHDKHKKQKSSSSGTKTRRAGHKC